MSQTQTTNNSLPAENLKSRAQALGLWGLLTEWSQMSTQPWLAALIECEERVRAARSLERRIKAAKLGAFKPMADFDWGWPNDIDRELVNELLALNFVIEHANVVIIGQNGSGKTMLAKNLAHQAVLHGYSALFVSASQLLNDLAAANSASALTRRLRYYVSPQVLVIDELGYLATSGEHADLLFELIARRYQCRSTIITSNKGFTEWSEVFPNASCVVALVDRLMHNAEILQIAADSYRLKEARERNEMRKLKRKKSSSTKKKTA